MPKPVDTVNHPAAQVRSAEPAAAAASAADESVLELVHSVMHAHRSRLYRVLRDGPHRVAHMEAKVLAFLAAHPGATQRDLAQRSGRDKAQLARLIRSLRDSGLLVADVDPDDRRNLRLSLTAAGAALHRTLGEQGDRLARQAVAGIAAGDQARLRASLLQMLDNLGELDTQHGQ